MQGGQDQRGERVSTAPVYRGKGVQKGKILPSDLPVTTASRRPQFMNKTFAVLGAGMQGTAAAYDLAKFAGPTKIKMADRHLNHADKNSRRVNDMVGKAICEPYALDALNPVALKSFLEDVDVVLSCLP